MLPGSPYTSLFSGEGEPGIRNIQRWIHEAWRAGYDPRGKAQFKGEIMDTSKWIGPSGTHQQKRSADTETSTPCSRTSEFPVPSVRNWPASSKLTADDFPKPVDRPVPAMAHPEPTYAILMRWVKQYFVSYRRCWM